MLLQEIVILVEFVVIYLRDKDLISSFLVVDVCVGCSLSCALTLHNAPVNNTIRMISRFINLLKLTLCTKIIRIVQNLQSERINRPQGSRLTEIINLP